MNKRKLHHFWKRLRPISYWYFLAAFLIFGATAVWALRQNNLKMVHLREAVIQADESGEGVEAALNALREHVYSHMNTDLTSGDTAIRPPIQLTKTYERLTSGAEARAAARNRQVTAEATARCEQRFGAGQIRARARCVQDYISKNTVETDTVPKELYQFDFVSPLWSPDLAGWSLLAALLFFFLFLLRFSLERWLRHSLDT